MPSTYSALLRLEKQAAGENDNTWGTKANTIFEMIEDAIAGTATITDTNGDVTLSTNNSSEDQQRKAILRCTATLTGNLNLIVPTTSKIYLIDNATSGAYSVTVKVSGQTGVEVAQGTKAIVFVNGTDVVRVTPDTPSSFILGLLDDTDAATALQTLLAPFNEAVDKTADYTVTTSDRGKLFLANTASNDVSFALPAAATAGSGFVIGVKNVSGTNDAIINPDGAETVDGAATYTMAGDDDTAVVVCDGTEWHVIATLGVSVQARNIFQKSQVVSTVDLTDGTNIAVDFADSNVFDVTLGGNRTLDNPSNLQDGQTVVIIVRQDATGGRSLAFGSAYNWPGGTTPTLSAGANAVDVISCVCDGTNLYCTIQQDFS